MATVPSQPRPRTREIEYPTGDGKPMAETQMHLKDMIDSIQVLKTIMPASPGFMCVATC